MNKKDIEHLIRSLGIGATYRGYWYLAYGISLCLKDEDYLLFVSKLLYPEIARYYCTTSCSVERNIRTVIKVCWERGNRKLLQEIALHPMPIRPTSSEFFDILTAHLKQNDNSKLIV
ncbi:sporulation initiation factor Spo0A C-terminal domain-containing protein [Faecalicatena contorta]|nr:sporulation initiation factor Spo0A C-terminal domain-containing protein [Faecalicatena contorta]